MAIYTLKRTQVVSMSLKACWDFFSNPHNLSRITPPALGFQIRSDLPEKIYAGLMIEYKVSPVLGLPMTWLTEIVQVCEPHYFIDEQRVGPYQIWHHEHFFRELPGGEVEVRDLILYVPPFGPFGAILNGLVIRPQLERIFDFRRQTLEKMSPARRADSFA